jgi:hypothetical protein
MQADESEEIWESLSLVGNSKDIDTEELCDVIYTSALWVFVENTAMKWAKIPKAANLQYQQ